jgi:hypothetical protein
LYAVYVQVQYGKRYGKIFKRSKMTFSFHLFFKAYFHSRQFSTDRKFSENIIVSLTSKFFSDQKFVSANHILQIFLSAENVLEWKWMGLKRILSFSRKNISYFSLRSIYYNISQKCYQCRLSNSSLFLNLILDGILIMLAVSS